MSWYVFLVPSGLSIGPSVNNSSPLITDGRIHEIFFAAFLTIGLHIIWIRHTLRFTRMFFIFIRVGPCRTLSILVDEHFRLFLLYGFKDSLHSEPFGDSQIHVGL